MDRLRGHVRYYRSPSPAVYWTGRRTVVPGARPRAFSAWETPRIALFIGALELLSVVATAEGVMGGGGGRIGEPACRGLPDLMAHLGIRDVSFGGNTE